LSFIDGDYDLVSSNGYQKITNISILDAIGYNNNEVKLSKTAIDFITESTNEITINNNKATLTDKNEKSLTIKGDSNDSVVLTDENMWLYNGIIDNDQHDEPTIGLYDNVTGNITIDTTRNLYGSILYQFKYSDETNGIYYLNVAANIGDHPDWYWDGSSSDEAYEFPDLQFGSVDFKAGFDTLELSSGFNNNTFDFSQLSSGLSNVELINTSNTYNNSSYIATVSTDTLSIDKDSAILITDSDNSLSIIGDSVDSVVVSDIATNWTFMGTESSMLNTATTYSFNQYSYKPGTADAVTLNIETELAGSIGNYYQGWESNDVLQMQTSTFDGIDGGAGYDILKPLADQTHNLDLTSSVSNIELLDMRNSQDNALTVNLTMVNSADNNTLQVLGDAGQDSVDVAANESWTLGGRVNYDDVADMYVYQSSNGSTTGSLYVQTDLLQNLYTTPDGTAADDTLWVLNTTFGSLDGGNGFDRLAFAQSGAIDLENNGAANSFSNIEVLDSTNGVVNTFSIGADQVEAANTNNELYILGDNNDQLQLNTSEQWSQGSSYTISNDLSLNSYTATASNGQTVTIYADSQINTTT